MGNPVIHFEIVAAGDIDAVRRFYADAFSWKINADNPMNYGLVDNEGKGINGGIGVPMNGGSYVTVYIEVDDLPAALDRIQGLGGKTEMAPMRVPNGPEIAMFSDPAGNVLGLVKNS